jgi:hypothetical protein
MNTYDTLLKIKGNYILDVYIAVVEWDMWGRVTWKRFQLDNGLIYRKRSGGCACCRAPRQVQ